MNKLTHSTVNEPGYRRKGRGKGFEYFDDRGQKIADQDALERINALRIPPAWQDVWICANPDGHLQATGIDARKRKQYLYHVEWNERSNANKFDRMADFAKVLPALRKRMQNDLRKEGWPREKVIALIVSLLDQFSLRIGNKVYEQQNATYGVTTLKGKHLKSDGNDLVLQYKAKGGKYRKIRIRSKKLSRLILECSELPGQEVFQYLDSEGNPHPVFSQDVNAYLQEISEGSYTAKDFRTWGGTVWAIELLPVALAEIAEHPKRNLIPCIVKHVAEKLGNTVAICKAYYIHPAILTLAESGEVDLDKIYGKAQKALAELVNDLSRDELIALYVIEGIE